MTVVSALGRFARPPPHQRPDEPGCELCAAPIAEAHRHVVDLERRRLSCACAACAVLFGGSGPAGRFRTVPDRVVADPGRGPTAAEWASLGIPVRLAFLFRSTAAGRWIAAYPGPAGSIEAELPQEPWARIAERLPLAAQAEPDVEALLFHGERGDAALEVLLVPIDACYGLGGRLRRVWRGFDGGTEARGEIASALAGFRARARGARRAAPGEATT